MLAAKRLVLSTLTCVLAIAVGCAQQPQAKVSPQKKTSPCGTKTRCTPAQLTATNEKATPAKPAAAVKPATDTPKTTVGKPGAANKAGNAPIDKQQLAARIREIAAKQAANPALHKQRTAEQHTGKLYAQRLAKLYQAKGKYLLRNLTRSYIALRYTPVRPGSHAFNPSTPQ